MQVVSADPENLRSVVPDKTSSGGTRITLRVREPFFKLQELFLVCSGSMITDVDEVEPLPLGR